MTTTTALDSILICCVILVPALLISLFLFFTNLKSIFRPDNQIVVDYFFNLYDSGSLAAGLNICALIYVPVILFLPVQIMNNGIDWTFGLLGCILAQIWVYKCHYPSIHYMSKSSFNLYHYLYQRYDGSKSICYVSGLFHIVIIISYATLMLVVVTFWLKCLTNFDGWLMAPMVVVAATIPVVIRGQKAAAFAGSTTFLICILLCIGCIGLTFYVMFDQARNFDLTILEPNWKTWQIAKPNIWIIMLTSFIFFCSILTSNQLVYQNYCSVGSAKRLTIVFIVIFIVGLFCWLPVSAVALFIKLRSETRDNMQFSAIHLLASYLRILSHYNDGQIWNIVTRVTLSCIILTVSMSVLPNALISLSSITWEDLFGGRLIRTAPTKSSLAIRTIVVLYAALICIISSSAFFELWNESIISNVENGLVFLASLSAPAGALFFMAVSLPCTNYHGAICGAFFGWIASLILGYGVINWGTTLPTNVDNFNFTTVNETTCAPFSTGKPASFILSCLSYEWLIILPFVITIIVSLITSFLTGGQELLKVDWNLIRFKCPNLVENWNCRTLRRCAGGKKYEKSFNLYDSMINYGAVRPKSTPSHSNTAIGGGGRRKLDKCNFRYSSSRQQSLEPFSDNNYHNPNVKTYFDSLSRR